jgi:hypothetical protein
MRYLVDVPAILSIEIEASNPRQAVQRVDKEIMRMLCLMSTISADGSPDYCSAFDYHIQRQRRVFTPRKKGDA